MACLSVTRHGFTTILSMMADVDALLTSTSHPDLPDPSKGYFIKKHGTHVANGKVIYESTTNIDPLADYTPPGTTIPAAWRIMFKYHDADRMSIAVATKLQLQDDGTIAYFTNRKLNSPSKKEIPGAVGANYTGSDGEPKVGSDSASLSEVFLNRQMAKDGEAAYPMSYTLTLTNRGFFFAVWEGSQEEALQTYNETPADYFSNSPIKWVLVQRSVDRVTGHVRGGGALRGDNDPATETSRCPVFCVFGVGAPNQYRRFIVRENDVLTPSRKKLVSEESEDCAPMINPYQQNSITETGEFVVTFLNNLTTSRYRYSDELDMVGTVGAEVIGPGTSINVTVYNETVSSQPVQRTYTALYANNEYGVGMRLMVLTAANAAAELSHVSA